MKRNFGGNSHGRLRETAKGRLRKMVQVEANGKSRRKFPGNHRKKSLNMKFRMRSMRWLTQIVSCVCAFVLLIGAYGNEALKAMTSTVSAQTIPGTTFGDIDSDGDVGLHDAIVLAKAIAGIDVGVTDPRKMDLNQNGNVDPEDLVYLLKFLTGYTWQEIMENGSTTTQPGPTTTTSQTVTTTEEPKQTTSESTVTTTSVPKVSTDTTETPKVTTTVTTTKPVVTTEAPKQTTVTTSSAKTTTSITTMESVQSVTTVTTSQGEKTSTGRDDIRDPSGAKIPQEMYDELIAEAQKRGITEFDIHWTDGKMNPNVQELVVIPILLSNSLCIGGVCAVVPTEKFLEKYSTVIEEQITDFIEYDHIVSADYTCWLYIDEDWEASYPTAHISRIVLDDGTTIGIFRWLHEYPNYALTYEWYN